MGPQEVDPSEPGAQDVPVRPVPGLLQGGEGQPGQAKVPVQDENAGKYLISMCFFLSINWDFFGGWIN